MQLLLYVALGMMMVAALLTVTVQQKMDAPANVVTAETQVSQYRMFMYVAAQYMSTYTGGAATLTWSTLKTAATTPSGAVNTNMPANWKVVAAADNSWVACTELDDLSLNVLQQLAAPHGATLNKTKISARNYVVVGAATDIGKAAQCE